MIQQFPESAQYSADTLKPFSIGKVEVWPPVLLAPMSGITCSAFRRLIKQENPGSVGLVVTEFISIEGLTRGNEQSRRMMAFREEERPISIQIFGADPDRMADAARMAEDAGADIVDINSGCPVPKVVKRGGGCELMRNGTQLGAMLEKVQRAVSIPLTLKIRAGWDESNKNAVEIGKIAQASGISMLTVHGRTRAELYRGVADWELIGQVARELSIPVVGSGDIVDVDSARRALASGVAGLMIGRGAFKDPWVFSRVTQALQSAGVRSDLQSAPVRDALQVVEVLERYLDLLLEDGSSRSAVGRMKQIVAQVTRGVWGGGPVRQRLSSLANVDLIRLELAQWKEEILNGKASTSLVDEVTRPVENSESEYGAINACC